LQVKFISFTFASSNRNNMVKLHYEDLKHGLFTSPQSGSVQFKRYIIENVEDLNKFREKYPQIDMLNIYNNMLDSINEGSIVLATDDNHFTGMPTYCFESSENDTHPSSIHRVK
jgi:hypothetical protein